MSLRRPILRLFGAVMLGLAGMVIAAQPAWAHADLLGTDPEYGAALAVAPSRVVIRYNLPVEVQGAQVKLDTSGRVLRAGRPGYASSDHKDVALPLPKLEPGNYGLTWFLFGSDGDVMGGELHFTVLGGTVSASGTAPGPARPGRVPQKRAFAPLSQAQDAARLVGVASLSALLGGVVFVVFLWRPGLALRRTRLLLAAGLAGAIGGNAAALGLKGAAVSGQSAVHLFSPTALTALQGTHVGRVLTFRLAFLLLAGAFLAYLLIVPHRAVRSEHWALGSTSAAAGVLITHGMLSHASRRGVVGVMTDALHLGAVAIWLGGLTMLAVVMLPRRQSAELSSVVLRWSRLAFAAVTTTVLSGLILLLVIGPRWSALLRVPYGRFLLIKLALVALLLFAAAHARDFVFTRLLAPGEDGSIGPGELIGGPHDEPAATAATTTGSAPQRHWAPEASTTVAPGTTWPPATRGVLDRRWLQPFVTAVTAELCIAASILTATAVLVGRPPPT